MYQTTIHTKVISFYYYKLLKLIQQTYLHRKNLLVKHLQFNDFENVYLN